MTPPAATGTLSPTVASLWDSVIEETGRGHRFCDLMATRRDDGILLSAHLAEPGGIGTREALVPAGTTTYPSLTPRLSAALWYEREISDLFGLTPEGHPALEPLLRPHAEPPQIVGPGLFTIPHGPVRSGVMESIEYLVETPGEDIPHLSLRLYYKHRGIEDRMRGAPTADGVLLAERTEGVASVAHALAFSRAVERLGGGEIPRQAALVRVLHAELERLIAHLEVTVRLCDAAGLAVATARFGSHKEHLARLVSRMCGSRFGRGVVIPGGVTAMPGVGGEELLTAVSRLDRSVTADARLLMGTASFLDRLRGTGPLKPDRARAHGALGPIGKASGFADDARRNRPYDAYESLDLGKARAHHGGDALTRLTVRWDEVRQSFDLIRQAAQALAEAGEGPLRLPWRNRRMAGQPAGRRHHRARSFTT